MGCASSRTAALDVYRAPPSSFAVFDVTAIEEPWLKIKTDAGDDENDNAVIDHLSSPPSILQKLRAIDDSDKAGEAPPPSWIQVSKELEDLKPKPKPKPILRSVTESTPTKKSDLSLSIRTVEELEKEKAKKETERVPTTRAGDNNKSSSLKDNVFIVRDKLEREKEGKARSLLVRSNPLMDFEEICPPGGESAVVVYTTSLGGVRRTHEDCHRVRQILESHRVVFDERDVALDAGFLSEMRELLGGGGDGIGVPRVFVKGRYLGGAEEVVGLNETGRLSRIFNWAGVERGIGRLGCGGCGGARFLPCLHCGGSCKVVGPDGNVDRCGDCNENGLVHCPVCI